MIIGDIGGLDVIGALDIIGELNIWVGWRECKNKGRDRMRCCKFAA